MQDRHSLFDTITGAFVPVHRDGHKFVGIGALVTLAGFLIWSPIGWIAAIVTLCIAYFFRDPERATPVRAGLVVSPADGKIVSIGPKVPPKEMLLGDEPMTAISIFLSVFDVHVNRAPVSGVIKGKVYTPGVFTNAAGDQASQDNERMALTITADSGEDIGVVQIAGLVARRIVTYPETGDRLTSGERFGIIRFGSRVDVYLPLNRGILAGVGQRTVGGETVLADLNSQETGREVRIT